MLIPKMIRTGHRHRASFAFAALALLVFFFPGASEIFQLNRNALDGWNIWKAFGGHFSHWNFDHLLWDLITFLAFGIYCERQSLGRFLATLGISAAAVSLTFILFEPSLTYYRGLSGIDSALFGLALTEISILGTAGKRIAFAATLGFLGKTAFELTTGNPLFVSSSATTFTVLPSAHIARIPGFISGIGTVLWLLHGTPHQSFNIPRPSQLNTRSQPEKL